MSSGPAGTGAGVAVHCVVTLTTVLTPRGRQTVIVVDLTTLSAITRQTETPGGTHTLQVYVGERYTFSRVNYRKTDNNLSVTQIG